LARGYNEKTWIDKSSIYERLKLLKDDGVDIVPLQDFKVSSRSITIAVLAQATVHKKHPKSQARSQPFSIKQLDTSETNEDEENARRAPNDSSFSYLE
jgi:hypothetical protein